MNRENQKVINHEKKKLFRLINRLNDRLTSGNITQQQYDTAILNLTAPTVILGGAYISNEALVNIKGNEPGKV